MIKTLYDCFQHWSETGSVYIISDPHLGDSDCKLMSADWPSPEEYAAMLAKKIHKNDTLICLGDVGDVSYLISAWRPYKRPHTVLIMGNHDEAASNFSDFFNEIYTGPLMIAQKIILSHEPIENITWALNIHGHNHGGGNKDNHHINLAANIVNYTVVELSDIIKNGSLKKIKSIHRQTIDKAVKAKK